VVVERGEHQAFQSRDYACWRPCIILEEAHGAGFDAVYYLPWEQHLEQNGYSFVYSDGLNRFFIANEHLDRPAKHSPAPPNFYDDWICASEEALRLRAEQAGFQPNQWAQMLIERSAELEALRADVAALRQSTSWRLTAPLRALRSFSRRQRASVAPQPSSPPASEPMVPAEVPTAHAEAPVGREPPPIPSRDMQVIDVRGVRFNVEDSPTGFLRAFWARVASGTWEPETLSLIERLATPGAPFVDIGAWIGPTTLFAAARGSIVHAHECDPVALQHLRHNIDINPDLRPRITVSDVAVGEANGRMQIWSAEPVNSETSIFARHEREGTIFDCAASFEVEVVDAAELFFRHGFASDPAAFIKIDIEGAEFRVLPRLAPLIAQSAAVWYVSFHELNINPTDVPVRVQRVAEMLRSLSTFAPLRWYDTSLKELDKTAVLDAVIRGVWPANGSLVFASRDLAP
jgi:FkbM family methyltransferase